MNTDVPDQLRLLALVERYGTLAGAADALGITPAAATQRLTKAERDWGLPLALRGPRGARLTPAGAVLAPFGRIIDRQALAAEEAFDTFRGRARRRLRIGSFQAAALHLLPAALTALRHRMPDTELSVVDATSDRAARSVADGELDVAVLATWGDPPPDLPGVALHHLLRDPLVVVLPDDHPLATGKGSLSLRLLSEEHWVVIRAGHAARAQFDRAAQGAGFVPQVRFQTESYDVAQALVGTGIGVALVSRLALRTVPGTVARTLRAPALHRDLYAALPADPTLAPVAETFLALLDDVARELRETWATEDRHAAQA